MQSQTKSQKFIFLKGDKLLPIFIWKCKGPRTRRVDLFDLSAGLCLKLQK